MQKFLCRWRCKSSWRELQGSYYIQRKAILKGHIQMRIRVRRRFCLWRGSQLLPNHHWKALEVLLNITNVWVLELVFGTRDASWNYTGVPRATTAGRLGKPIPRLYPAGARKDTNNHGIGKRKFIQMMLDHYRQTKNMLISYQQNKLGFSRNFCYYRPWRLFYQRSLLSLY